MVIKEVRSSKKSQSSKVHARISKGLHAFFIVRIVLCCLSRLHGMSMSSQKRPALNSNLTSRGINLNSFFKARVNRCHQAFRNRWQTLRNFTNDSRRKFIRIQLLSIKFDKTTGLTMASLSNLLYLAFLVSFVLEALAL